MAEAAAGRNIPPHHPEATAAKNAYRWALSPLRPLLAPLRPLLPPLPLAFPHCFVPIPAPILNSLTCHRTWNSDSDLECHFDAMVKVAYCKTMRWHRNGAWASSDQQGCVQSCIQLCAMAAAHHGTLRACVHPNPRSMLACG